MCGSSAPPAPKPDPNIGKALKAATELGKEYLAFSKEQFAVSQERQKDIDALTKEISTYFMDLAEGDRDRYETVFKPLEDEFIKTAREYDSPERQEAEAAKAKADVLREAELQRGASERRDQSYGIRPDSGRYAGLDRAFGVSTALGAVDAQNKARTAIQDKGLALERDAINLGRGTQAFSAQAAGAAANPSLAANAQWMQTPGIVAGGYNSAIGAYGQQASGLNDLYRSNIGLYNTQSELSAANSAGFGNFLGTAVGTGAGLYALSDKDAKRDRKKVDQGEGLEAVEKMPVESYRYKEGVEDGGAESHVGPMAQDYQAATGRGDGKTINLQDAIGVTMQAVKDLSAKVDHIAEMIGLGQPRPTAA